MKKPTTSQNVLLILAVTLVALILVWLITRDTRQNTGDGFVDTSSTLSLYYREECPHCKNVETYLFENKVEEKIKIEHKEVTSNIKNQNELMTRAALCGLDLANVGVPMLYDKGTCYSGDTDIINYFQSRL
ncbi:MAG: glutaredoxin family protein [Candidatus Magasanikbacteria bacterium]|nr:glutaredoxin family protein [Candidatus Magasanikbacteria bacterium]